VHITYPSPDALYDSDQYAICLKKCAKFGLLQLRHRSTDFDIS